MTLPVIEIVFAPATAQFLENPQPVAKPTMEALAKTDGQIQTYYGIQHEDKVTAVVLVGWESLAAHQALMNDKEAYPVLVSAIGDIVDVSKLKMIHVAFTSEPWKAIEAPVVEIATFKLNEGKSKAELEAFVDAFTKIPDGSGAVSAAWGPAVEDENLLVLFIGWTSVEAHWSFVKSDPNSAAAIGKAKELATVTVIHAALTRYQA